MRQNIVFMINSLAGGGAERIMARLLSNSQTYAERYEIHLVLLDNEPDAYEIPDWLTVHRLDTGFSLAKGIWRGTRLLRRLKPALCLSFLSRSNFINVIAARLSGHKAVISERVNATSHHPHSLSGRVARLMTQLIYPRADAIICPSAGIARDLCDHFAVSAQRTVVIPNPIDTDRIRALSDAADVLRPTPRPYIVAVGRFVENKNFSMLLAAFAQAHTGLDLVVLGEGPLRSRLDEEARTLGISDRVIFPGFAKNPFPIVKAAQFYVLPSNAEGFPNGLAEAITLGVAVVSTNCLSGPSEILDDQDILSIASVHRAKYGMLVPVNDAASMAAAIEAMSQPETSASYAALALKRAEKYRLAPAVRAYWDVLEKELR